jgi:hypothetical protein
VCVPVRVAVIVGPLWSRIAPARRPAHPGRRDNRRPIVTPVSETRRRSGPCL